MVARPAWFQEGVIEAMPERLADRATRARLDAEWFSEPTPDPHRNNVQRKTSLALTTASDRNRRSRAEVACDVWQQSYQMISFSRTSPIHRVCSDVCDNHTRKRQYRPRHRQSTGTSTDAGSRGLFRDTQRSIRTSTLDHLAGVGIVRTADLNRISPAWAHEPRQSSAPKGRQPDR